jgi:hypothetical protein
MIYFLNFKTLTLKEKGQYVTNAFTTTCDYLVFCNKIFALSN